MRKLNSFNSKYLLNFHMCKALINNFINIITLNFEEKESLNWYRIANKKIFRHNMLYSFKLFLFYNIFYCQ